MTIPNRRAVYNVDSQLRILSANDQCLALWGKNLEDVIGKPMIEVFPQVAGTESYEAHTRAMKSLKPLRKVVRSPVLDVWIELEIYPGRGCLTVSFTTSKTSAAAD